MLGRWNGCLVSVLIEFSTWCVHACLSEFLLVCFVSVFLPNFICLPVCVFFYVFFFFFFFTQGEGSVSWCLMEMFVRLCSGWQFMSGESSSLVDGPCSCFG